MATVTKNTSSPSPPAKNVRPRRFIKMPDAQAQKKQLEAIRSDIQAKDRELAVIKKQIEATTVPKEVAEKRKELNAELSGYAKEQAEIKKKRQLINDQIKAYEGSLKRKIGEIQAQQQKNSFKSVDDIDKKIQQLDDLIGTGTLKIVDEKRYIKEISSLRKLRKDFGSIEAVQKSIDEDKQKVSELKKTLSTVSNKEIQAKYEKTQKELDDLYKSSKTIHDKLDTLYKKKSEINKAKDELYATLTKTRSEYDAAFAKFKADMDAERKKREEEEKVLRLTEKKEELEKEIAEILEKGSVPALTNEINSITSMLHFFDPSYQVSESSIFQQSNGLNKPKKIGRVVEMPADAVIISKKTEDLVPAKSKSKSHKSKSKPASKFVLELDIISKLSDLSISLPTSADDVPATVEELKKKLEEYKGNQAAESEKKVSAANAKADKLKAKVKDLEAEIASEENSKKEKAAEAESEETEV